MDGYPLSEDLILIVSVDSNRLETCFRRKQRTEINEY